MPSFTPETAALLALIRPDNAVLLKRWVTAVRQAGGMYASLDESGLVAMASMTMSIFQASLGDGFVPTTSTRRYVDPPPYRQQPLDEFVLAGVLVDRTVRDYLAEQGADPEATTAATARFSQTLVNGILDVVRLRQARMSAGQLLSDVGRTLAGVGTANQRLDRAASRIATELSLGPCVILSRADGVLRVVGCDARAYGDRTQLADQTYPLDEHPWVDRVVAGAHTLAVVAERSVFERRVAQARFTTMYARALTLNESTVGVLLVFGDDRRTLDARFAPHLDAVANLLAPHVALSDSAGALQKAESAIDELFEASPNLMCTLDRLGRIERTNSAFRQCIGVPDDVVGMPLSWMVHPAWLERFTEQWTRMVDDPRQVAGERIDLISARSERIPLALEARWLRDGRDQPTHCLVALSDIARYVAQAEAAAHQIDELNAFAHQIAHDLRGPLRSIAGFSGLLEDVLIEAPPDAESARTYAARIEAAVDRADVLITGLLRFAQTTHVHPLVDEVSTDALLTDALAGIEGALELRQITVTLTTAEQKLLGDRTALSTLLMNLIDNGARYTPEGGVVEVAVRTAEPGWATLEVRDEGPGIDPLDQARIFRLFERGDDPASQTGVGLAIVRRIARAHGGRVTVQSAPDEGATFKVTLPTA